MLVSLAKPRAGGFPEFRKGSGRDVPREFRCKQRGVVIAQRVSEKRELAQMARPLNGERQDEQQIAARAARKRDDRSNACASPDAALPDREPIERLKRRTIGVSLKSAPLVFQRVEISRNREWRDRDGGAPHQYLG